MTKRRHLWLLAAACVLVAAGAGLVATTAVAWYPPVHFFTPDDRTVGALHESPGGDAFPGWRFRESRTPSPVVEDQGRFTFSREASVVGAWLARAGLRSGDKTFWAVRVRQFTHGDSWWSEWVRTDRLDDGDFTPAADLVGTWRRRAGSGAEEVVELRATGQIARAEGGAALGWWGARGDVLLTDEGETGSGRETWARLADHRRQSVDGDRYVWTREP